MGPHSYHRINTSFKMDANFLKSDIVCRKSNDVLDFGRIQDVYKYDCAPATKLEEGQSEPDFVPGDSKEKPLAATSSPIPIRQSERGESNSDDGDKDDPKKGQGDRVRGFIEVEILWDHEKRNCFGKYKRPFLEYMDPRESEIKVADRRFVIGQRVEKDESRGTIISIEKLITLKVMGSDQVPIIIPDVKMESIQPITNLFYGVMIEYDGWIGQITRVSRKAIWSYPENGPRFFTVHMDPHPWTNNQFAEPGDHIGKGYPYLLRTDDPYPGKKKKFGPVELQRVAIGVDNYWMDELMDEEKCIMYTESGVATVLSVRVDGISVTWLGRLPSHLDSRSKVPPECLEDDDVERVNILHISPAMYLDKVGLASYTGADGDRIVPGFLWRDEFFQEKYPRKETQEERQKDPLGNYIYENATFGQQFVVHKVFSRNLYSVRWEDGPMKEETNFGKLLGSELKPEEEDLDFSCRKIFSGYFFCKRITEGMVGFASDEYGVVLERGEKDDTAIVQWLKILENGKVKRAQETVEECPFLEIKKHPIFGDITESRMVVKSRMALDMGFAYGFTIGTVISIDRWNFGMVEVFCTSQQKMKRMWPHELETFQVMTAEQMIKLKLIGRNKEKKIRYKWKDMTVFSVDSNRIFKQIGNRS